jgi:hypothetical protein
MDARKPGYAARRPEESVRYGVVQPAPPEQVVRRRAAA